MLKAVRSTTSSLGLLAMCSKWLLLHHVVKLCLRVFKARTCESAKFIETGPVLSEASLARSLTHSLARSAKHRVLHAVRAKWPTAPLCYIQIWWELQKRWQEVWWPALDNHPCVNGATQMVFLRIYVGWAEVRTDCFGNLRTDRDTQTSAWMLRSRFVEKFRPVLFTWEFFSCVTVLCE